MNQERKYAVSKMPLAALTWDEWERGDSICTWFEFTVATDQEF